MIVCDVHGVSPEERTASTSTGIGEREHRLAQGGGMSRDPPADA